MIALIAVAAVAAVVGQIEWRDPSPHRTQIVTVDEGVQVEVLDWGGLGRPIVLLAGYQTAHVFDGFAPKLTASGRVYGVTRRGYGASSRPPSGYSSTRQAGGILRVLDALHLADAVLVGHSFGALDMTVFAQNHASRVAALVYLNPAEDATVTDYGVPPPDPKKLPAQAPQKLDYSSFQAYRESQLRIHGVAFPESELRWMYAANPDGSMGKFQGSAEVRQAIFKGMEKPDFAKIHAPVLVFNAIRPPPKFEAENEEQRLAVKQAERHEAAIGAHHVRVLKQGIPSAKIVDLPDANWYDFLSNEAGVLREIDAFVKQLPAPIR